MCNVYGTHSWLNFSYLQWNEITTVAVSPLALQATFWQGNCIIYVDRRPTAPFLPPWLPAASLCAVTVARYGLLGCGKSKDWGCLGPGSWGQFLDLGEGNLKEAEQNCLFRSITIGVGVQYSTAQHSTAQDSTAQHSTVQYSTVQHSTVQYNTVQYSTAQYSTVECSTVQ